MKKARPGSATRRGTTTLFAELNGFQPLDKAVLVNCAHRLGLRRSAVASAGRLLGRLRRREVRTPGENRITAR